MKLIKYLLLLISINAIAQITAPGDCIDAYRLCDANVSYNFQLLDWGVIDDGHGVLNVPSSMGQTTFNQWESKSAWIKFTPKYSGTFGLTICPETVEKLNFMLCLNANCSNIESGNYNIVEQGRIEIAEPNFACTGIGIDPNIGSFTLDWPFNMINIQANQNYLLFVTIRIFNQVGSHRFNLSFQGSAVTNHPDLFDNVACQLATSEFVVKNNVSVYPNPFNEKINISSNANLARTEIYDLLGKNVYSQDFKNEIDTSFLQAGVYIIKMYGVDNEVFIRKIIKR